MDKQYSVKFFTSFVEAMQKLCREYLDFEQGVELSGYLAVEIDNFKKERYVLSELVQSTGNVISESYCTKAFKTLRKEIPPKISNMHGSENIAPRDHMTRTGRSHSEEVTIVLRDSPETVSHHANYQLHTTPFKSSNQKHSFNQNPHVQTSSHHRDGSYGLSPSNKQQLPFEIQPRCSESLQALSNLSPKAVISQKRSIMDTDASSMSSAPKRDKTEYVESGIESLLAATENTRENVESSFSAAVSAATSTESTDTGHSSLQQDNNESLNMPIEIDIKQEKDDDSPFMIIENPNDPTVKMLEAEGVFGRDHDSSQTLALDTSTSFSADSQSADNCEFKDSRNVSDRAGISWESSNQPSRTSSARYLSKLTHADGSTAVYKCHLCEKQYSEKRNLWRHNRFVHEKVKKYVCSLCGQRFMQKCHLTSHLNSKLVHAGFHNS